MATERGLHIALSLRTSLHLDEQFTFRSAVSDDRERAIGLCADRTRTLLSCQLLTKQALPQFSKSVLQFDSAVAGPERRNLDLLIQAELTIRQPSEKVPEPVLELNEIVHSALQKGGASV